MTRFVTLTAVLMPFLEIPGFVLVSHWIGVIPMLVILIASVSGTFNLTLGGTSSGNSVAATNSNPG
jgi:UPF0716 family protein affecting phage T7 exclusion